MVPRLLDHPCYSQKQKILSKIQQKIRIQILSPTQGATGSLKHYESTWGKWVSCRSGWEVCLIRFDVSYVLDFLADVLDESCQYKTIALHRSALSTFHDPI